MTWIGALGLGLALYGLIVLLEWIYSQVLNPAEMAGCPEFTLVWKLTNMEATIEDVVRQVADKLPDTPGAHGAGMEFLVWETGSTDQTRAIVERLAERYRFLTLLDPDLDAEAVLGRCQHPVIVWVNRPSAYTLAQLVDTLRRLAEASRRRARSSS